MVIKAGHSQSQWWDLVLLGSNSDRSDLVQDQVGGGIAWEKGGGQIVDEQEEHHPSCCLSVLYHVKPFDIGIHKQPVRVLVERHELHR